MGKWRRNRRLKKVRPGDGSALPPFRFWQLLTRTLFYIDLPDGHYAADVHFFADDASGADEDSDDWWGGASSSSKPKTPQAALYRDGRQLYRSDFPAVFPAAGGTIEVETSVYGLKRMHYVPPDGPEQVLRPDRAAMEGLRARFGRRYPALSRTISVLAILILLACLVVGIPQLAEAVTSWEPIAERVGTFDSPINLPDWFNSTLLVAGIVAALERALTLRNNWLIDIDTTWWGFA
ncbi:MAG: hypothetical protein ACTHW1_08880, partial [Ancrocorticia sp.]|uniref:hypothetical protein n=1 Tax=Ancrocorticia sp. TaxID=2593684 RepID=UPI003F90582D